MLVGLAFFGVLVGFSSGFFGIGGGTILVPTLIYLGYDIKMAIGISVMQMIFSSMFGSYVNYKAGVLQFNSGLFLGFGALFWCSTQWSHRELSSQRALLILFAVILALSIYKFFMAPIEPKVSNESKIVLFIVGVVIGAIAISTGTGGAIF